MRRNSRRIGKWGLCDSSAWFSALVCRPASHPSIHIFLPATGTSWLVDAFELWCWRRPLKVPWTARRSRQSILKEINPEHSLEGLVLKLRLKHFGHLMRTDGSLEKSQVLGKTEGRRRRRRQRMRWLDGVADIMNMDSGSLREMVRDRKAWQAAVCGVTKSWTWLGGWTRTTTLTCKQASFQEFFFSKSTNSFAKSNDVSLGTWLTQSAL